MSKENSKKTKNKDQIRIEFLERQARLNLFGLDILASLGELQHSAHLGRDPHRILNVALNHVKRLVDFQVVAFYLVDEDSSDFVMAEVTPLAEKELIKAEVDREIENGSFAWALNRNRAVVIKDPSHDHSLVFHVLATKTRVRGMFVGRVLPGGKPVNETILYPLSVILQNTSNALESGALYKMIWEQNQNLEETVRIRTQDLEKQTLELKEEIAFRKIAEESLVLAKEEAEAGARAKSEFLANMSHEIRTPLNAILGYGEILQFEARKLQRPDFVEDLKAIEFAGRHLLSLINEILVLSKIQAGKMEIHPEYFDLSQLIEEVVSTVRPLAQRKKNKLEVIKQELPESMNSDSSRIRQILLNLLGNSCKFTDEGEITLTVTRKIVDGVRWIYFTIGDTGIGIEPEKIPELFEEFAQADSSTTRKHGGTGLGLTISKRLSQLLGGDIQATSEMGKGASFTVFLPENFSQIKSFEVEGVSQWSKWAGRFLDDEPIYKSEENETRPLTLNLDPLLDYVLVIDNDEVVCNLIKRFLEKEGCKVEFAHNLKEGLRLAEEIRPLVIILDIMVEGFGGGEALAQFHNNPSIVNSSIILLTEADTTSEMEGVTEYLSKPLDWDQFVTVFKKYQSKPTDFSIMIVEDDAINREALTRILNKGGWKVIEASDGPSAFELLNANKVPDMIFLDLILPSMNGFEFIVRLRQNQSWKNIPIVVNSAKELTLEEKGRLQGDVVKVFKKGDVTCGELLSEVRLIASHAKNGNS
ncbi:MAG: response regulator [Nitrospina sp.]|nr:response regulator [Nitrospina sp.]MBT3875734.1 response regulator [Nitrospina sp.]MBT4049181.1 response regulator [Nitrospina sp.]MBT4557150.1 response regulator [Nitrospina sp.]MBT5349759.1 response regulator [Nitrospina sp.]